MIGVLVAVLGLLLAFPAGWLLAYLCRDELVIYRNWFKAIILISFITSVIIAFINFKEKWTIIFSLMFLIIISGISLFKGFDKKFI
jgi:hypothetical protein